MYYHLYVLELWFDEKVFPTKIEIYETFNPGTIVKILACDADPFTEVVQSGRKVRCVHQICLRQPKY